jgi:hypothetical protein
MARGKVELNSRRSRGHLVGAKAHDLGNELLIDDGHDVGTIRPALRKIDAKRSTATEIAIDIDVPEPLVRNEPVTLRFSLTPQPVVLKAGERLRLDIGSRTDLLVSNVSQGRAQFQMQVPPYFSRNTLHYGAESYIELRRVRAGFHL